MVSEPDTGDSKAGRMSNIIAALALIVSIGAAAVAVYQTQRANDISDDAYKLSQALAPKVDVYVNVNYGTLVTSNGELAIRMQLELVNTGDVHLSGCGTYSEDSDAKGTPIEYWPAIMEHVGATWDVASGAKHLSDFTLPVSSLPQPGTSTPERTYVAIWYECESAHLVTRAYLFGIDLEKQSLIPPEGYVGSEVEAPMKSLAALGSYERYAIVERAQHRTPEPRPTPTPQFTTGAPRR